MEVNIVWFRRDLRLEDNTALLHAIQDSKPILPIFIFDTEILEHLDESDARVSFIYETLQSMNKTLKPLGSGLKILHGKPIEVWEQLIKDFKIDAVYTNKDYEPYAITRDKMIETFLEENDIKFRAFKDQVIFEENEILKTDGKPYTVYTPYKNKWLEHLTKEQYITQSIKLESSNFYNFDEDIISLSDIGFKKSTIKVKDFDLSSLEVYDKVRNDPVADATSYLSPHLRFGTVSIRAMVTKAVKTNQVFLSELIWREFFMQILFHFPDVVDHNFKRKYDVVSWRNNENEFKAWCEGKTGYPMVDAGMRQLNATGYMHNRVRMITAGFLCKHLLIDWKWGEAYFASKLLDYDLSANNGNWQWSAGTGCDAAPYFRIFNPITQLKKFDPQHKYVRKWIKDLDELTYPNPIVEHSFARKRALDTYKNALES